MDGLLAVAYFVDSKGKVLVSVIVPHSHPNWHNPLKSFSTSQFEQHFPAIFNLPAESGKINLPSVMINILGSSKHQGPVMHEGSTESRKSMVLKFISSEKTTKPIEKWDM